MVESLHPKEQQICSIGFHGLIGSSLSFQKVLSTIPRLASSNLPIIIEGETGTGKELIARAIHNESDRCEQVYSVLDCSTIPKHLAESLILGHERGAFTGALQRRKGVFERSEGGTVFLDEIGELPLELQPKLLRVLESGTVLRIGGDDPINVNTRLVAATNRDLKAMVAAGTFRQDLYYRLAGIRLAIPPLRQRGEDILQLTKHFIKVAHRQRGGLDDASIRFTKPVLHHFMAYPWPGNIRELKNTIETCASLSRSQELDLEDVIECVPSLASGANPETATDADFEIDLSEPFKIAKNRIVSHFEEQYLKSLMVDCGGNVSQGARTAGVTRYYLRELLKKYGLHNPTGN